VKVDFSFDGQVDLVSVELIGGSTILADAVPYYPTTGKYTLTFTTSDWDTPRIVTVKAVNDTALEGTHYSRLTHTVQADSMDNFLGVTKQNIADGLAAKVSGDLDSDFDATANGDEVTITGPAFTFDFASPYTTATVTLGGTAADGETWALVINGKTWSYSVVGSESLNNIAENLRTMINGQDGLTVTRSGSDLTITSSGGLVTVGFLLSPDSAGTASITGTPLGYFLDSANSEEAWEIAEIDLTDDIDPVTAGNQNAPVGAVWTVSLDGTDFSYTRKGPGSPPVPDSLNIIASALADTINQSGTRFQAAYVEASVKLYGTPSKGDVWTLELYNPYTGARATASYTVQAGDSLTRVTKELADSVHGLADYSLNPLYSDGDTELVFHHDGTDVLFTASLSINGPNLQSAGRVSGEVSDDHLVVLTSDGTPFTVDVRLFESASATDYISGGSVLNPVFGVNLSDRSTTHYAKLVIGIEGVTVLPNPIVEGAGWDLTLGTHEDSVELDFSGAPADGEVWTIRLIDADGWVSIARVDVTAGQTLQEVLIALGEQFDDLGDGKDEVPGYDVKVATDDGDPANPDDDGTRLLTIKHMGTFDIVVTIQPPEGNVESAARLVIIDDQPTTTYTYVAGNNREVTLPDSLDIMVADNDAPGVLILQTANSTDVIEPTEIVRLGSGYLSQLTEIRFRIGLGLDDSEIPIDPDDGQTWTVFLVESNDASVPPPSLTKSYATAPTFAQVAADLAFEINKLANFEAFTNGGEYVSIKRPDQPWWWWYFNDQNPFSVYITVTDAGGKTEAVIFAGDFGTAITRELGIHDSVFTAQDIDAAKWNNNANTEITNATILPHLTVLGTGDGNPDFYSFEVT
jgi:hypothetical protein